MATPKYNTEEERREARLASGRASTQRWKDKNPGKAAEVKRQYRLRQRDNPEYIEKRRVNSQLWRANNRERHQEMVRKWMADNPERAQEMKRKASQNYRSRYPQRIKAAVQAVKERRVGRPMPSVCEVCRREPGQRGLCADHCHSSGHYRAWLCFRCNFALGLVDDDPNILRGLIALLEAQ